MRYLPALVAAAFIAVLTPNRADACGGPIIEHGPRVLAVKTHAVLANKKWTRRAFVVLDEPMPRLDPKTPLTWLAARTYDNTEVAEIDRLDTPIELTLVGPAGTRVVKATRRFAIRSGWQRDTSPRLAIEVPIAETDQFSFAFVGRLTTVALARS